MSEAKHSPEPWRALLNGDGPHSIADPDSRVVVSFVDGILRAEDARRIVAAVNACAGIPIEALEAGAIERALDRLKEALLCYDARMPAGWVNETNAALRALGRLP